MKQTKNKKEGKESLEDRYLKLFNPNMLRHDKDSLEQPHTLEYVESVTTYGAYQKPILCHAKLE
jgi:hypothetical protein